MIEIILKLITLLYNTSTIYEFGRLLPLDVLLGIIFICVFPICVFLYLILTKYFWNYFSKSYDQFEVCKNDLIEIAGKLDITYNECNIYLYCILFPAIVVFHLIQIIIFRKK